MQFGLPSGEWRQGGKRGGRYRLKSSCICISGRVTGRWYDEKQMDPECIVKSRTDGAGGWSKVGVGVRRKSEGWPGSI